ncbi:hypothetical protein BH09PAT2_BH09PAT2_05530 [soil metagenome]
MNPLRKIYKKLTSTPNKKHYVEFVTALLSIPVLLTVVYMNYLSIQEKRVKDAITPTPAPTQQVVTIVREKTVDREPTTAPVKPSAECTPGIGPITINNPEEGSTVSDNPVRIEIQYDQGEYCAVVWSYRINGSTWSDYDDNDFVIYNMPSGQKKLELRVKSIVSGKSQNIERNFVYKNAQEVPTPTVSPTNTPSPTPTGAVQNTTTVQ